MEEKVDIDDIHELINIRLRECKQLLENLREKDGNALKNSYIELQMARLQEADEILRKPLDSFKQKEVVQDLCFQPTYFMEDLMIPCTDPDEELSYPFSNLKDIDRFTLLEQEWLLSWMGEFALPWKYFDKRESVLTVPLLFTFKDWYNYLLKEFQMVECQYTWICFLTSRLYPLLRLCTKWLKCAIKGGMCHGDLLHYIYFRTDIEPQLLVRRGFDHKKSGNGYTTDLETSKHFLFVILNKRPLEELQMVNQLNYCNFNNDVPPYLIDFFKQLDSFDEQKHIVDVVFNPPFLWSIEKKIKHLEDAFMFFTEKDSRLNEINEHPWWPWYADFIKLPEHHPFKKILELTGSPAIIQSCRRLRQGNPKYENNAQLLRLFRNAKCHVTQMFPGLNLTQDDVLEEFEEKFNILSKLSLTCNEYALGLQSKQLSVDFIDFLERLGYYQRDTVGYYQAHN